MCLLNPHGIHESGNIVSKNLGGIDAFGLVRFTCPSKIERNAGKVLLGVLRHLEGIAGMIGGQVWNENEWLTSSLLVVIHRDVIGFDLRHGSPPVR